MNEGWTVNMVKQYLLDRDIKPSVQRLAVMTYLLEHRTHPTVEDIYNDLKDKIPTISKTTIYNTLKLFALKKAILSITIDEKMVRYDGYVDNHAHFICLACGKVVDVPLQQMVEFPKNENIEGFALEETHVYHRGYCPDCLKEN